MRRSSAPSFKGTQPKRQKFCVPLNSLARDSNAIDIASKFGINLENSQESQKVLNTQCDDQDDKNGKYHSELGLNTNSIGDLKFKCDDKIDLDNDLGLDTDFVAKKCLPNEQCSKFIPPIIGKGSKVLNKPLQRKFNTPSRITEVIPKENQASIDSSTDELYYSVVW